MNATVSFILLLAATVQVKDDAASKDAARRKYDRLLEIYRSDAAEFTIYRDKSRKDKVELRREPVLVCYDPTTSTGSGAIFVWTCRGHPEVIGMIFTVPTNGPLMLHHEFHSLSLSVLDVSRPGRHASIWAPEAPGIELAALAGAPPPAQSAPRRLLQMRGWPAIFRPRPRMMRRTAWSCAR